MKKILISLFCFPLFAGIKAQVGVNTTTPTATVDINGTLRVRDVAESSSQDDVNIVADNNGNIRKQLNARRGIFRGYLTADFEAGTSNGSIYKILNWNEIDDPNNDFTQDTGIFVPPISGLYRVNITAAISSRSTAPSNYVIGLADSTGSWVMRFSLPGNYIEAAEIQAGSTGGFTGVVHLTAKESYYFGVSYDATIVSKPSGSTGVGLGTYFDVQLIKAD